MFCHKCGTELPKDSGFCNKCGAKIMRDNGEQQAPAGSMPATAPPPTASTPNMGATVGLAAKKKKPHWLLGGLALAAIVVIVAIIASFFGGNGGGTGGESVSDYVEAVKELRPFSDEGLNQTYQEVLSDYISDLKWTHNRVGDGAEVVIKGTMPQYGITEIVISIMPVPGERDLYSFNATSVSIGDDKDVGLLATATLRVMFYAHGAGYPSMADYATDYSWKKPIQESGASVESGSESLTGDEAYSLAKAWADAHPAMNIQLYDSSWEEEVDGQMYYLFVMDDPSMYWFQILVQTDTGELFCQITSDGEEPEPPVIEKLDDYYNRYYDGSQTAGFAGVMYKDISLSEFFVYPLEGKAYTYVASDGLVYDFDTGILEGYELSSFEIDGISLDTIDESGLKDLLGEPAEQDWGTERNQYYLRYDFPGYEVYFFINGFTSVIVRLAALPT